MGFPTTKVFIKGTKKTGVKLNVNIAPCSRPTTNVISLLHECKKVCPCTKALPQSGIRAWIKQGWRKRKKRGRETGKTEARRLMERKAAQQNKNTSEELKQGLPAQRRLTKQGKERLSYPSHRMRHLPHLYACSPDSWYKSGSIKLFI